MEKKIVTLQELDELFKNLLAFADLDKITATVNLFMDKSLTEEEVLTDIKDMYNRLCQDIADKEISESDLPIGHGRYGMMLEYTGGDPAMKLVYEMVGSYAEDC